MVLSLTFKMGPIHLLLFLCFTQLWGDVQSNATSAALSTTAVTSQPATSTTATTTSTTPLPTPIPVPDRVTNVTVLSQTKISITLRWDKVEDISTYRLTNNKNQTFNINDTIGASWIEYVVQNLTDGTKYDFTLYTVLGSVNSEGCDFSAVTEPEKVTNVTVLDQTKISITLRWDKVENISTYRLTNNKNQTFNIDDTIGASWIEYVVQNLTDGTKYDFTLYTVLGGVDSEGCDFSAVTEPKKVTNVEESDQTESTITLEWEKVGDISTYRLTNNKNETFNISDTSGASRIEYVVRNLTDGTKYDFILYTVLRGVDSEGYSFSAVTAPSNAENFKAANRSENCITLQWDQVKDIRDYMLRFNGTDKNISAPEGNGIDPITDKVCKLTMGEKYTFTLFTVFETIPSTGTTITAVTAPRDAEGFKVEGQTETNIILQWRKVNDKFNYTLLFDGRVENVYRTDTDPVTYVALNLTAGKRYEFSLFTVFDDVKSLGNNISAVTAPLNVNGVTVIERSVTKITLQWSKVNGHSDYSIRINGEPKPVPPTSTSDLQTYEASPLKDGTLYDFILYTVFYGVKSQGYAFSTITAINCAKSKWDFTSSTIEGSSIDGSFTEATATNGSDEHLSNGSNVSFTGLYPGSTYNVSLWVQHNSHRLLQCSQILPIYPARLIVKCTSWSGGYGVTLRWNEPKGYWIGVQVDVKGKYSREQDGTMLEMELDGFQPAKTYNIHVVSRTETLKSDPFTLDCATDPSGVIAGSVFAVLILVLLICLGVYITHRRPEWFQLVKRRKKTYTHSSELSAEKYRAIPLGRFSDHFHKMSADENKTFSEEYEDFDPVGREQTRKHSDMNLAKNRFNNVYPYDWSRVKLSVIHKDNNSDYINANYIAGYTGNRQYIAAQGPLPNTVNDFWRMIWEQGAKRVVMVTNCNEGGRVKCERYWPLDYTPCLYGDLLVTVQSEDKADNWTLREFRVKNRATSEERTVKHFHFTAWPDHGVPECTDTLINFRGLIREHIDSEGGGTPTVVHCSAGVGRTGTIIALDVLLQQLEREKAVGIAAFVYKMRLSRPLMVQTESQYVFLHQCIMDVLEPSSNTTDHLYENTDMIYANATAIREFETNKIANTDV